MKTTLSILETAYKVFSECEPKRTRTFNDLAKKFLWDQFSARGIYATYQMDYYKFMKVWVDATSELNAVTLYTEDKVLSFLQALNEEIDRDVNLKNKLAELTGDKPEPVVTIKEQVEEALEEFEELPEFEQAPEAPKAEPVKKAPVAKAIEPEEPKTTEEGFTAGLNFNIDLGAMLKKVAIGYLESDAAGILAHVQERIKEEALKLQPNQINIPGSGKPPVVINGRLHKKFADTLFLTKLEGQAFLSGAAGTGKTTLASQVAEAMALKFGHISCTAGMSEAHLLGRMVADGSYIGSQLVDLYENGGVFLFDEVDAADANTMLILNSALANGYMSVPNRKDNPIAKRHPEFYAIAAANTWGSGSNEYVGRGTLDSAFLDRFVGAKIEVDYDTDMEREILSADPDFANAMWMIRANVLKARVRRPVSTRAFKSAALQLAAGRTREQFLDVFFTGWSKEERLKATSAN